MNYAPRHPDDYGIASPVDPVDDGFDVRRAMALLWRARWKIGIGALVGLLLAAVQIAGTRPTYTAVATVLFSPEQRNIVDLKEVLRQPTNDGLRNQIEILRSTNLMLRVVDRLRLTARAQFNPALAGPPGGLSRLRQFLSWRTYVPSGALAFLGIIPRPAVRDPADPRVAAAARTEARVRLSGMVVLSPVPASRVINIAVTTDTPALSAEVVNAIAHEYITAQLDAKLSATREATLWLSDRVEELKNELAAAEASVTTYQADLAARTGQTASVLEQQLGTLNLGLAQAAARRAAAEIRHLRARDAMTDPASIAAVTELQTSAAIAEARRQQRQLEVDRAELAGLVAPGHDRLRLYDARIDSVREAIRTEVERVVSTLGNEVRVAGDEETDLRAKVAALEERLQEQSGQEVKLRQLEREVEASRLIYQSFLGRLKETTQQEKLEEADAVVLSPAEPPRHADSGSRKRVVLLSLMLGAGLGLGASVLRERLDNAFRSLDDLQRLTGLSVLGTVPMAGRDARRADVMDHVLDRPSSHLAEAVRSLRTSLLFSHIDRPPQVVMFTSSEPGEGKSTTSLLLALTSAQMGKSAIIVDCDLRRPALADFFGERAVRNAGLRGVLDKSVTLADATVTDPVTGLAILSTDVQEGTVLSAADVLSSDRFGALLTTLRESYDLVILDAPPTLSVTDARIVAQRADATLYCVRWGVTPRDTVLEGLRELRLVRPNIAGVVATMVDVGKAGRYGYPGYTPGRGGYYAR